VWLVPAGWLDLVAQFADFVAEGGDLGGEGADVRGLLGGCCLVPVGGYEPGGGGRGDHPEDGDPGDHQHDRDRAPGRGHRVVVAVADAGHRGRRPPQRVAEAGDVGLRRGPLGVEDHHRRRGDQDAGRARGQQRGPAGQPEAAFPHRQADSRADPGQPRGADQPDRSQQPQRP
jgi:hypothetical protein